MPSITDDHLLLQVLQHGGHLKFQKRQPEVPSRISGCTTRLAEGPQRHGVELLSPNLKS